MKGSYPIVAPTFLLLAACWLASPVLAGSLSDFEKAATEQPKVNPPPTRQERQRASDYNNENTGGSRLDDAFFDAFFVMCVHSGRRTLERMRKSESPDLALIPLREIGAPDLPLAQADVNYQRIDSRTHGIDARALIGYGPVGAQYRQTRYTEKGASDPLNFIQMHGLFRMSWSEKVEFGMGYGGLILDGRKRNDGFSMTYPLSFFPTRHLGLNFTPTWSWINDHAITDCDSSVAYVNKYFSVRAGYRRIKVRDQALSGPYVGLSFHF
ncbi:MAG: hypothetical protein QM790_04300 [Nibricoccus sp.]